MAEKRYIESAAATTLFARACGECKEACEEFDGFYADCNQCLLHGVLKEFAAIPAADVRPVARGRWITPPKNRDYAYMIDYYECPLCGYIEDCLVNFCPNCGADMREKS